mgnify:FL=1
MFSQKVEMTAGDVKVITTKDRGKTPEEVVEMAMERIIHVSGEAPDIIKQQINAYQQQLFHVLVYYMKEMVQSDRTNVINLLEKEGHSSLADLIRRM